MEGDSYKPNTYTVMREGTGRHYTHRTFSSAPFERYKSTFQTLDHDNKCSWQFGDIIQFGSAFHGSWKYDEGWPRWFIKSDEEYCNYLKKHCPRTNIVPLYAHEQYAIIINRYRWIKEKYKTFYDYGSIIMMLSGKRIGHIRRYYVTTPWSFVAGHPYKKFAHPSFRKVVIPLVKDVFNDDLHTFLKNITEKFT